LHWSRHSGSRRILVELSMSARRAFIGRPEQH